MKRLFYCAGVCCFLFLSGCTSSFDKNSLVLSDRQVLVQTGETLYSIALKYKVSPREIMRANYLASSSIQPRQVLLIPVPDAQNDAFAEEVGSASFVSGGSFEVKSLVQKELTQAQNMREGGLKKSDVQEGLAPAGQSGFMWPVTGSVLKGYKQGTGVRSAGVSIGAPLGSVVVAAESGSIAYVGSDLKSDYGLLILLTHQDRSVSVYGYLSEAFVKKGDSVTRGQVLGAVGSGIGLSKESSLYFELRLFNKNSQKAEPVNPLLHLKG